MNHVLEEDNLPHYPLVQLFGVSTDLGRHGDFNPANHVAIRVSDEYRVAFQISGANTWGYVHIYENGEWRKLGISAYSKLGSQDYERLKFVVEGGNITAYENDREFASYFTTVPTGKFGIRLVRGSSIDSVKISRLPD